jgi:F0F1-type ATP synthase membrane subunit b/b'
MKEVIERMLKVEEEARAILAGAERKAGEIAEQHRRRASRESDRVRGEAHAEAARQVDESRKALDVRRREDLARFDRANAQYADAVRARFQQALDLIVRSVSGD